MTRLNQRAPTVSEQFDSVVDDRLSQDGVELFGRNASRVALVDLVVLAGLPQPGLGDEPLRRRTTS
jgi:hypothetical protein